MSINNSAKKFSYEKVVTNTVTTVTHPYFKLVLWVIALIVFMTMKLATIIYILLYGMVAVLLTGLSHSAIEAVKYARFNGKEQGNGKVVIDAASRAA